MRITMRQSVSGTRNGRPWPAPGGSCDLPDDEAEAMVALGYAVKAVNQVESAEDPRPAETAAVRTSPRKRGGKRAPVQPE